MSLAAEVAEVFDRAELTGILLGLVQQPSDNPPGLESGVARLIEQLLGAEGIECGLSLAAPERPNVMASVTGTATGPKTIYNGHMDVVPVGGGWTRAPTGVIEGDRLYGRGAADMKGGVAAMLYAGIVLKRMGSRHRGEVLLFFNVDEERTNLGMTQFLRARVDADFAIVGEPTSLDVCVGHRGCARYRLRTFGTPGHTAVTTEPDSAISKMTKLITALETEYAPMLARRRDAALGSASLVVSQIAGGTAPNIVPDRCEIELDRRIVPEETRDGAHAELLAVLEQVAEREAFGFELDDYLFLPASTIDEDHELVREFRRSSARFHPDVAVRTFGATCEAPFFSVDRGIPTIIYGPGDLAQAHVPDEYVELHEVESACRTYIDFVLHR
jgi:succinyl-diaminopimelate desuccinylase